MENVGWASLQIIPSMRGVASRLRGEAATEIGRPLEQAADDAGDRSSKAFGKRFGSGLSGVAKTAMVGFGAALGVGATAAAVWGIKTAAANEQAAVAFTGMLGDAQKAQDFIAQMKDFAAKTPFELPGLQDAARQLLGVGFSAENVIPTLTTIGDTAAALGVGEEGIQSVIRALGQMKGKGKASAEELMQISEAMPGFSAIDAIAKSMGITTAEAFKKMEAGAIPADKAIQAVLTGMEKFPGAAGAMDRQSQTLNGMLSTLKDTLGQGLAAVMTPVVEGLKSSMPQLTETISGVMTTAGPVIAQGLGSFLGVIGKLLPAVAPVLDVLGGVFVTVLSALEPVITKLTPYIAQMAEILGEALGTALATILPPLGDLLVAFAPLLPIFAQVADAILQALAPVLGALATALVPVISGLVDGIKPVFDALLPLIPQLAAAFMPLIPPLGRLLVALTPLIVLFATLFDRILIKALPVLTPIIEKVATFAGEMIDKLIPAISQVVGWITRFADALFAGDWASVGDMLSGLWDSFANGAGDVWKTVTDNLGPGLSVLGDWIANTGLPWLGEHLGQWASAFAAWVPGAVTTLLGKLGELLGALGTWLVGTALPWLGSHLLEWAGAFAAWVPGAVTGLLGKLGELLAALGSWIMETALPWLIEHLVNWGLAFLGWIVQTAIDLPFKLAELLNAIVTWVVGAVPGLVSTLGEWIGAFVGWVADAVTQLPGKLAELGGKILDFVKGLPSQIADAAKDMWVGLTNAFIAAVNWIIRTWNGLRIELPEIDTHIPGIGKVGGFTLDTPDLPEIPSIPSFHTGGVVPGRGSQDVLAMLQAGEVVLPRSAVAAGAPGTGGFRVGDIIIQRGEDRRIAKDVAHELRVASLMAVAA